MEELLAAINEVYAADEDLVAAIPGGLWREKAKSTSVKPYGRYFVVSGVPITTAEGGLESVLIQFDVFTDSQDSRVIWNCHTKLIAAFGDPPSYTRKRIAKTLNTYVFWRGLETGRWEEGEMYHLIVQYRVEVKPN